jgi:hypothetical protein
MHFYALRIVCKSCRAAFLFGGGSEQDMGYWKGGVVACRACGAQIQATDAPVVPLRANGRPAGSMTPLRPRSPLSV